MRAAPKPPPSGRKSHGESALELARRVLVIEADAVRALVERLDERFLAAVALIVWLVARRVSAWRVANARNAAQSSTH